jgi:DNA primase
MRIPDSKIDEVRSASDIVDVISAYVPLKKRGKNYTGLCPFHQEKTPSFSVSADKQMYYCFGCGVGGNVFTFVMEHDKVSFVEAVRTLARRAGIAIPEEGAEDKAQETENEALYNACRAAGLYFHENLVNSIEGKLALEYFHHRGFTDATIRKFGLGYSLNAWDGLVKLAEEGKMDLTLLAKAGLVLRRDDTSGYYDRFRGRAMFPIFSTSGRTVGFGARKMREDDPLGKYINSPETPIYNKSRILYGLFQSKEAVRAKEYAILVEGYADLISVFQGGIENIVASSGTALTEEQIQLIGRYAKNVTLVYDADSAGSKATIRGVDLIIENGLDVKVAELPQGEDPDSFVRKEGGAAFQKLLDQAVSFLDFKARLFQTQGLLATPEGKTHVVRSIVETISKMKDELKRNFFVKSVSEKYDIYESVLFRELEKQLARQDSRVESDRRREVSVSKEIQSAQVGGIHHAGEMYAPERDLIKVMLEHGPPMAGFVLAHLKPSTFAHAEARQLVTIFGNRLAAGTGWDANSLVNEVQSEDIKRMIADIVFSKYDISKGWGGVEEPDPWEVAERAILRLKGEEIDRLINEQFRQLKDAESNGQPIITYQQQIQLLQQEKRELKTARLAKN